MRLNKVALAVIASAATAASAGVTVTPALLGYHYTDEAHDKQREVLLTGKQLNASTSLNGGVATDSGLYTGAAIGVELTPSTQFQVEYGVSNSDAQFSDASAVNPANRFDAEQETISGNFLIGTEQFSGYNPNSKFKPYVLIGAGQSKVSVKNQQTYVADATSQSGQAVVGRVAPAGTEVTESKDTIGNLGLGARYLVNDALALRGEARAIHNFDNKWWEGLALAGVEVTLGGRLSPTVPVPPQRTPIEAPVEVDEVDVVVLDEVVVDSDMDGVPDNLDACPGTPRNLVVDARGCPIPLDIQEALNMELRVFFDNDKTAIKPQYRQEIAKVAEAMREYPNAVASIEGHASKNSKRSSAKYNQRLSEARATAVKSMLTNEFGVAPNRLSTVGYGFDRPIASNDTKEGQAQNRRVYAKIQGSKVTTVNQTTDMQVR